MPERAYKFLRKTVTTLFFVCSAILIIATGFIGFQPRKYFDGSLLAYTQIALPLSLAVIFFWLGISKKQSRYLVGVTLISTLGAVLTVECILEVYRVNQETRREIAESLGLPWDSRSKIEVVSELRDKTPRSYLAINPTHLQQLESWRTVLKNRELAENSLLPLSSISNAQTVLCNENGSWVTYPTDRYGFNNPDRVWDHSSIQVAVLGDSFVQGYCVNKESNFVSLVRRVLPGTINLGVGSNGPLGALAIHREYLFDANPEIVLYTYYENDLIKDLPREVNNNLLKRYLDSSAFSQELKVNQDIIDELLMSVHEAEFSQRNVAAGHVQKANGVLLRRLAYYSRRVAFLSNLRKKVSLVFGRSDYPLTETKNTFRELKARVSSRGGQLFFVYLPHFREIGLPEGNNPVRREILLIMEDLDVPVIDLLPIFMQTNEPLNKWPFERPGHYNEEGYSLVAQAILAKLGARQD